MKYLVSAMSLALALLLTSCGEDTSPTLPRADRATPTAVHPLDQREWSPSIDNPFLPLIPGTVLAYSGRGDGQPEIDRTRVTHRTKTIIGVVCTEVEDSVFAAGLLKEATLDWYAQDTDRNVWYFGEDTKEFDTSGNVISTEGTWEAGVNGAQPGIVMEANPQIGDEYGQEFSPGVAEDMAKVLALHAPVDVPYGRFTGCLKTKEWTPLEPKVTERKYYAPNVGFVKSVMAQGGNDESELVSVTRE